ncbi:nidogen [Tribolium madens]|uniref:nidogen n=1 Tax=Tribolium madens TaxID=41895 RepID=UPI001CF750A6|nr:nidogen [Tribolium madens]
MKLLRLFSCCLIFFTSANSLPVGLLYNHNVPEAFKLPQENDVSSPEIKLKVPVVFYGTKFNSIFVNSNGFVSFQTEIPNFFNIEFPLDYPLIAPFYTNVDTRSTGTISYYETGDPSLIRRATENVREYFSDQENFQAKSLFIVTWFRVGYFNRGSDKTNTYQLVIITDGAKSFVELLYPKEGIQWIQGTGDESGLPDARAQAGFISAEGKMYTLPGSGTEQVRNLEVWSNIDLPGQFIYRVDGNDVVGPDLIIDDLKSDENPQTCAEATTYCHVQANCLDYEEGFCCQCKKQYYGNGRFCVKKDVPLRVNGKINGKINGERLENLDLQSYIVMVDGRAYTAISKIPESIGFDIQSLQILGGVIGYIFAKPIRNAQNGYQFTGGVFNHTAILKFLNTSQTVTIKQKYMGLDVFDQLRLETNIQGDIPTLPFDSKVEIDEYQEQYTLTSPGVIQMSSTRFFKYLNENKEEITVSYDIEQVYTFDYCKYENVSLGETWKLKVGKNFISYESKEQIIRFGLTNKIMPLGEIDPCQDGRSQCTPFSACVVDGDSFRCVCNPGFQQMFAGNETICADIDECQTGLHSCDQNAACVNQVGSYSCTCNPGFTGNGQVCENEFTCHNVICPPNSECLEGDNVAVCRCMPGFSGDGQVCTPLVDRSCHTANNCDPFAVCTIDPKTNSYYCACLPGYEGDGYSCNKTEVQNVTEVTVEKEIQRCVLGVCWCPEGYTFEKGTTYCIPKDVTTVLPPTTLIPDNVTCDVLNNCGPNAQCVYSSDNESFLCKCNEGYDGDGYKCEFVTVSCAQEYNCGPNANCHYDETVGKSKCVCNPGYFGDGFNCTISAICTSNADCTQTEECLLSSSQRYECICREGYVRDSQHQCIKPSTCGGGICVENAECLYDDTYQLHYCSCKSGYMGDGITECKPRPIGCNIDNKCGLHATCEYDPSTSLYECQCERGYYGDGYVCYTEINCHIEPTLCDPQATCVTDSNRRYICQCNTGYVGNGTICQKNPTHEGNFLLLNQGMSTLKIPFEPTKQNPGKPIQVKYFQTAVGLDIDCYEGRVYWGDISGRAIRSSTYNGSNKSDFIVDGIGSPEGLAVDWISRNIYWTDSTKDTVEVASIETRRRRVLFDFNLVNPRGIAIHPQRGKIFWTDWDRKNPKIEWANADGTGRSIFLQGESVSLPNSLTIDYDTEQLCYADAGTKKIECIDIDSKIRRTIATNCTYPFGITVTDKHIYWSDWITKKIERADKNTLTRLPPLQVPLGGSGNKLFGLVAVPQSCPQLTNVCQYYKDQCPVDHICLPNGAGSRTCVCTYKADSSETPSCKL